MYNITDIIAKQVINLYNGNTEGTVKNICFDNRLKKATHLILFNDSEEEEMLLAISKIYKIGSSAITIKNSEGLLPTLFASKIEYNNQINNTAYSLEGDNLGVVKDIVLTDSYKVDKIIVGEKEFSSNNVISFNDNNLILNSSGVKYTKESCQQKLSLPKPKLDLVKILPKMPEKETDPIPKIEFNEIDLKPKQNYKISENPLPQRMITSQNYLLGRKLNKTIYGLNNEIIAKKDCIITEKILNNAKSHNKLVELAVFSKAK